jgi:hypothetical protein
MGNTDLVGARYNAYFYTDRGEGFGTRIFGRNADFEWNADDADDADF